MVTLRAVVQLEIWFWLGGLLAIVLFQMLTRRINLRRLLAAKGQDNPISPERVQLLVFTLAGALGYFLQVAKDHTAFPDVPPQLLLILGGSNVLYLTSKWYRLFHT